MDMNTIQLLIMIGGFVITLSVFLYARGKDAENRGRLMQRVDTLEAMINELKNNHQTVATDVACHDADLSKVTTEIDGIKHLIEKIDEKLDRLIERREGGGGR
jgi:archaellum component FlaC